VAVDVSLSSFVFVLNSILNNLFSPDMSALRSYRKCIKY
jgi:hypothetical protein